MKKSTIAFTAAASLFITACGHKVQNASNNQKVLLTAGQMMNNSQYEDAIKVLQAAEQNPEIKQLLIDALAGSSGVTGEKMLKLSDKIKSQVDKIVKVNANEFLNKIENMFIDVPELSSTQRARLNKSIELSNEFDVKKTSRYNNFKFAALRMYRLSVNLRDLARDINARANKGHIVSVLEFKEIVGDRLALIIQDGAEVYKRLSFSYSKLAKFNEAVVNFINKTYGNVEFTNLLNSTWTSNRDFYSALFKNNQEFISSAIARVVMAIDADKKEVNIELAFRTALVNPETVESFEKTKKLVSLLIGRMMVENAVEFKSLENVFNQTTFDKLKSALTTVVEHGDLRPLYDLVESKDASIDALIKASHSLSSKNYDTQYKEIKNSVDAIIASVDREMILSELRRMENTLLEINKLEGDVKVQAILTNENLIKQQQILTDRLTQIEEMLKTPTSELVDSLNVSSTPAEYADAEKANQAAINSLVK